MNSGRGRSVCRLVWRLTFPVSFSFFRSLTVVGIEAGSMVRASLMIFSFKGVDSSSGLKERKRLPDSGRFGCPESRRERGCQSEGGLAVA